MLVVRFEQPQNLPQARHKGRPALPTGIIMSQPTALRPLRKPRVLLLHAPDDDDDKEYSWQVGLMMMASLEHLNTTPTIPAPPLLTSVSFTDSNTTTTTTTSTGSTPVARAGRAGDEVIKATTDVDVDVQRPHSRPRRARSHPSHLFTSANTACDCTPSSEPPVAEADHHHHLRTTLIGGAELPVLETFNTDDGRQRRIERGRVLMPFLGSAHYSSVSLVIIIGLDSVDPVIDRNRELTPRLIFAFIASTTLPPTLFVDHS